MASPWDRVAPAALTHLYLTMGCASSLLRHLFNAIHARGAAGATRSQGLVVVRFFENVDVLRFGASPEHD